MDRAISFLHCDHVPRCTGSVDKVFEGYSSIQFMASGSLYLAYDGDSYALEGPWTWAAWPGPHTIFHKGQSSAFWDHRYLAFRGPRVDDWQDVGLLPQKPVRVQRASAMAYDFDRLIQHARRGDKTGQDIAACLLEALLLSMRDGGYGANPRGDFVAKVDDWLFEHRFEQPDYAALARDLRMGESTLRRRYGEQTGMSLHTRFLAMKLDTARDLISEPDLSIKEIAHRLGYCDVYYFSKQFRRHFGVPPAAFRRSIQ